MAEHLINTDGIEVIIDDDMKKLLRNINVGRPENERIHRIALRKQLEEYIAWHEDTMPLEEVATVRFEGNVYVKLEHKDGFWFITGIFEVEENHA